MMKRVDKPNQIELDGKLIRGIENRSLAEVKRA